MGGGGYTHSEVEATTTTTTTIRHFKPKKPKEVSKWKSMSLLRWIRAGVIFL
jgi:hypothetical protein